MGCCAQYDSQNPNRTNSPIPPPKNPATPGSPNGVEEGSSREKEHDAEVFDRFEFGLEETDIGGTDVGHSEDSCDHCCCNY